MVGKNPLALDASIASHAQYDRGDFAVFEAASAFWLMALKLSPGGSISPFCDPASVTSMPHSSCLRSIDPSEDTASTSSNAGCLASSIARRISGSRVVTPVDVSLWTTSTALMRRSRIVGQALA